MILVEVSKRAVAPQSNLTTADCGYCALEGPDEFGNYDLLESPDCPYHGEDSE